MIKSITPLKSFTILISFLFLFLNHSGHAQCSAYFQSVYNGATDEINFTQLCTYDTTIHPVLFVWDFGDGTTAVEENPAHHYVNGNNYLVCLVVYVGNGAGCCQDTFCEQIDFNPASIKKNPECISDVTLSSHNKLVSLFLTLNQSHPLAINLISITGRIFPVRLAQTIRRGRNEIDFSMDDYPSGIYMLRIEDEKGNSITIRFSLR